MPLRFTIRDLLWLTLMVAILAAWWVDHHRRPHFEGYRSAGHDGLAGMGILTDNETGESWHLRGNDWIENQPSTKTKQPTH